MGNLKSKPLPSVYIYIVCGGCGSPRPPKPSDPGSIRLTAKWLLLLFLLLLLGLRLNVYIKYNVPIYAHVRILPGFYVGIRLYKSSLNLPENGLLIWGLLLAACSLPSYPYIALKGWFAGCRKGGGEYKQLINKTRDGQSKLYRLKHILLTTPFRTSFGRHSRRE